MNNRNCLIVGLILAFAPKSYSYDCDRTPEKAAKLSPNRIDNNYIIEISGNPKSYVPGQNYTINLKSNPSKAKLNRFTEFTLVLEPENVFNNFQTTSTGRFHLIDDHVARFHFKCPNTVIQMNTMAKTEVTVAWIAPPPKSGCLAIKATVFESSDNWFSDDGELTKILCEENSENEDTQPPNLKYCCACEEAKYEVAFQGLWSRNTHPKDFPTDVWTTKFSDVVGASHKLFRSFWDYGGMASPGLQLLAEEGNTSVLETELKEMVKSDDIRTIIKARELSYPNNTGTSYTVFRVDPENHVISLVSKITPSPDWIVGVAKLELCLMNCSWVESRTFNLYPWDVGTDDGISYNSPDSPATPHQPIRRIKSNNPNKEESPFYNEAGEPIKPLAKLHLTRQKLYEKATCVSTPYVEDNQEIDANCATSAWTQWSACSNLCARFRQRFYMNAAAADHCTETMVESESCTDAEGCQAIDENDDRCQVGDWSDWSSCSATCGKGVKTRDRQFLKPAYQAPCSKNGSPALQETEDCEVGEDCETEPAKDDCPNTEWGDWTPCSATCGNGTKERVRVKQGDNSADEDDESESCSNYKEQVECSNPECESEQPSNVTFGAINTDSQTIVIEESADGLPVIDCKVSKWSIWSPCNASKPCKKGYKFRERHITIHASNGGRACPTKLQKKKRCKAPCPRDDDSKETLPTWGPVIKDCVMEEWSAWSPCSINCGAAAVQQRTRGIKVRPSDNGRPCGPRKEEKKCPLPLACNDRGTLPNYR